MKGGKNESIKINCNRYLYGSRCNIRHHYNTRSYKDLGLGNYPILTNYYIDGLIGIVVFFIVLVSLLNILHTLLKN